MSKIIIAQMDFTLGKISENCEKILSSINKAKEQKADAIIFPACAITGFPLKDILKKHKHLYKEQIEAIKKIQEQTEQIIVILGCINEKGKESFVILNNKQLVTKNKITIKDVIYKIICGEYNISKENSTQNIIHISASSSRTGKEYLKNEYLTKMAKENKINYIYVNTVGYADNQVYDGASRVYNKDGNITARAKSFEEDFLILDNLSGKTENIPIGGEEKNGEEFTLDYTNDLDRLYKTLICGIKGYFRKNGFSKAILGLSGGLDSTICAVLLVDALGKENIVGVSMPTKISSQGSKDDAKILAKNLGITYLEVPISDTVDLFKNELNNIYLQINMDKYKKSTTLENVQARTRATILWSIANEITGMLPIATSDKSEGHIGYATINGDMSGGFAPITDVTKTKLFALGDFMNKKREQKNVIPKSVLEKPPGAELKFDETKGRTITAEEDNMPYPFLDEIIYNIETFGTSKEEQLEKTFIYERNHPISKEQKKEWLDKFYNKYSKAIFKWHLLPPGIITGDHSINQSEYYHPIV